MVIRANRPAPEWLVASAPGAVEPVKMNCSFAWHRSSYAHLFGILKAIRLAF